ncbi:hypothetical protein [Natronobacterium gregoryi]|nr:hypothetical protein [Natronobacterium gregoryi]ELY72879.1 calcium-binding outer membrane-like protein [Natronobacterium gregoryi SP2]
MKKGTLAATALAVGAGATAGSTAAQENDEGEVVVHAHDYYPEATFEVLTEFDTPTRDSFLENLDEDGDVFDDPADWNVHAVRIETDGDGSPLGYVMEEETLNLSEGDGGSFAETASFRSPAMNLLEVDATAEEVDDEDDEVDDEDDEMNDEVDDEDDEMNDEVDDEDDEMNDEVDDEDDEMNDEVDDEENDNNNNNNDNDDGIFG